MPSDKIEFTDKIFDNVHGFIPYTKAEGELMNLLPFKRLQSIKQLSLVNWVFPGSEHTRFVHSIGVMHIADKIAIQLKLPDDERKILRLAGLLHDIGHYPLSHVCEFPYRKRMEQFPSTDYCRQVNLHVANIISEFSIKPELEFMPTAVQGHHEEIGSLVIKHNDSIRRIISGECGEQAIETICDIITGNVERAKTRSSLLVQILHSELDADGIDYMLRDAVFSGTSFGSFEVDQLIRCMESKEYDGKLILCITPKGIAAADQYLINKFFSYSQVLFNKHTIILEWMAEQIVSWMQENATYFPRKDTLRNDWIIKSGDTKEFLNFNDNYFWSSIKSILENPAHEIFPPYILSLCQKLLHHQELTFVDGSEVKLISNSGSEIKQALESSELFSANGDFDDRITTIAQREITKHIPLKDFKSLLKMPEETDIKLSPEEFDDLKMHFGTMRLIDGICVHDGGDLHLLCDDPRSLMRQLCRTRLVVMRSYNFSC